jgi:UDP-GlcNAc:undecaprenyl-phosphate GlcNAc-1-phosphate transferase
MQNAIALVAAGALGLLVSFGIIPVVLSVSHRREWYDIPNERKIHTNPIPRLGGIGIFWGLVAPSIAVPLFLALLTGRGEPLAYQARYLYPLFGFCLIHGMGLVDDFHNLNAGLKFTLQIVAASLVTVGGFTISRVSFPGMGSLSFGIFSYPLTVLWIVALSNAINLVDGVDGLAGGIAALAALSLALMNIITGHLVPALVSLALLGSVAGFLAFNLPPARIFMGDSGALLIGFVLAVIPLMAKPGESSVEDMVAPATLLAIPILDTLLAIIRRVRERRAIHSADKAHIHHRLLALGLKEPALLGIVYSACIVFGAAAVGSLFLRRIVGLGILAVVWILAIAAVLVLGRLKRRLPA